MLGSIYHPSLAANGCIQRFSVRDGNGGILCNYEYLLRGEFAMSVGGFFL